MSAKKLSTVATDVIESYGNTAKNVIHAYRAGGERVGGLLERGWDRALKESRSQLATGVAKNANAAQQALTGYYTKGLIVTSDGAEQVVDQMVKLAGAGVERVAANAQMFEYKTGVTTLNTLAQATLPGAVALSTLATKIEVKSATLANKIAGEKTNVAMPKRKAPVARKAAAARKPRTAKAA
ncbi:hypothetical protein [Rhodoferax sp.]|uniref:hypothetical protein n=1 Tax=Rhodoferax sp. TaxID=50421 RepID=UPI00277A39AD|nr:hypothetical protein [Rhodoferax sp.]